MTDTTPITMDSTITPTKKKRPPQMNITTMPNNILVGSEKLFRTKAPWKIERSLLGTITNDHHVLLFDECKDYKTYKKTAKKLARTLTYKNDIKTDKLIFIGLGNDCRVVIDLYLNHGFKFDAAVFINNTYSPTIYDPIIDHCSIYNFYTNQSYEMLSIDGAEVNEFIKTRLPAHMSNRLAQEVFGCLLYQTYERTYLDNTPGIISYV
jgi:hypothetical protein